MRRLVCTCCFADSIMFLVLYKLRTHFFLAWMWDEVDGLRERSLHVSHQLDCMFLLEEIAGSIKTYAHGKGPSPRVFTIRRRF